MPLDPEEGFMLIDCDSCTARGAACADCVVTVLLGGLPDARDGSADALELDDAQRAAIGVLAEHGMVPPLRLVTTHGSQDADPAVRAS